MGTQDNLETPSIEHTRPSVPASTTPTWEMELLVSGGTTFGLLQLPALVDRGYYYALSRSSAAIEGLLFPVWFYVKVSLVILIVTFIIHLCLRGYWVALVGMDSVYPGGVRWHKLRMGPHARALHESKTPAMPVVIETADNRATRVFGLGFGMAMVLLAPIMLILVSLVVALLIEGTFGPAVTIPTIVALLTAALLPSLIAVSVDLRRGARLPAGGKAARLLTRVMSVYRLTWFDGRRNLLLGLFFSHEGRRRALVTAGVFMLPIMFIVVIDLMAGKEGFQLGSSSGWPVADLYSARSAPSAFYADLASERRQPGRVLPYIPERIARDDYLPLFVPFIPKSHRPAMAVHCPGFSDWRKTPGTPAALDCLASLTDVRLDGKPLAIVFEASTDPVTGQPGMLAMLPVSGLSTGRHELSLNRPSRLLDEKKPPERYRIAFWK